MFFYMNNLVLELVLSSVLLEESLHLKKMWCTLCIPAYILHYMTPTRVIYSLTSFCTNFELGIQRVSTRGARDS